MPKKNHYHITMAITFCANGSDSKDALKDLLLGLGVAAGVGMIRTADVPVLKKVEMKGPNSGNWATIAEFPNGADPFKVADIKEEEPLPEPAPLTKELFDAFIMSPKLDA